MKKTKQSSFIEWNYNILISSIKKININIILIMILDVLFYTLSAFAFIVWSGQITAKMESIILPSHASLASFGLEKAQQAVADSRAFFFLLVFSIILMVLAIIFLASVLKGVIWTKTTNTKITLRLISEFLGLNLIWMSFWFGAVFLVSYLIKDESASIFMLAVIILGLYFTNTLYTIFMKEQKLKSIFNAIKLNIVKIHLFLLPYAIILLLFYVIIKLITPLQFKYSQIIFGLVVLFYSALVRYYISALVLDIDNKNLSF